MPKMTIEQSHALEPADVRQRLDGVNQRLAAKYGITSSWKSDTEAKVNGTGASGTIQCLADKVVVNLELSFFLSPMAKKIESRIRDELQRALTAAPEADAPPPGEGGA